jgi:putative addiction module component (TIGR02574 family)
MSTALDDWKARLASLSGPERAELAHFLLGSLEPEDEGAEAAWDEEASRRVREIRAGTASGRDADAFLAELRERYP